MKVSSLSMLSLTLAFLVGCGGSGDDSSSGSSSSAMTSSSDSSTSDSSSSAGSEALNENWELIWHDEFDGEGIDADKWSFEVNCTGGGNNELQCYTPRSENAYVEDGHLHIVARQESFSGPGTWDDDPSHDPNDTSVQRDYTSARLRSKNKGDFTYGRMEIRAKLPQGQGIWPAFWMLPTEAVYGGWPRSGEIDVLEAVNTNAAGGNEVHGTLHYGGRWPGNRYSGTSHTPATNVWEQFHTYAVEWSEGEIHWFVDDVHYATQTHEGWYTYYAAGAGEGYELGEGSAPFDQAFHLIVNLAVGGDWPGAPNEQTQFPQTLEVDHIRVYQCALDTQTGQSCSDQLDQAVEPLDGFSAPELQSYSLYDDGAATVAMDGTDGTVDNPLTPGQYQASPGNLVVEPALSDGGSTVWDAEFFGTANIFLASDDMADISGVDAGLNLSSMVQTGQLAFDIKVDSIADDAEISVKLDSGWPHVSAAVVEPVVGEWTRMAVRFDELAANTIEPGEVDFAKVVNPFVLEVSGGHAKLQLNNIALECAGECAPEAVLQGQSAAIDPPHTVFEDSIDVNWDFGLGIYETGGGHVTAAIVEADEGSRGQVLDVQFGDSGANGLAFIQSTATKDMSAFAGGSLSFDVRVLDYASAGNLIIKADCVNPCSSGDIDVGMVGVGEWETVTVSVDELAGGGLDLSRVNTPFVILPPWNSQANVHLQVDNIRYTSP